MIKATELRIGNKINSPTHDLLNCTVCGMMPDSDLVLLREVTTYDYFEKIEPIPLTFEWLERMGFKLFLQDKIYSIQVGNTLYIDLDMDFDCSITPETWRGSSITPWADIKYVHQLQNLYFALTGQELKLKDQ